MLSRIADSLFWIGRYVERAEQTARIVEVGLDQIVENTDLSGEHHCRLILGIVGLDDPHSHGCSPHDVLSILASDASNPSSVAGALHAARENARGSREVISAESWQVLNVAVRGLPSSIDPAHMHGFFRDVSWTCMSFSGTVDAFMPRDEAWNFLRVGRLLERLDLTARLMKSLGEGGVSVSSARAMLRMCGAHDAYLRRHHGQLEPREAVKFLLLDMLFPRSAVHCLDRLSTSLDMLGTLHGKPPAYAEQDVSQHVVGQALSSLRYRPFHQILENLPQEMNDLTLATHALTTQIQQAYISPDE